MRSTDLPPSTTLSCDRPVYSTPKISPNVRMPGTEGVGAKHQISIENSTVDSCPGSGGKKESCSLQSRRPEPDNSPLSLARPRSAPSAPAPPPPRPPGSHGSARPWPSTDHAAGAASHGRGRKGGSSASRVLRHHPGPRILPFP